MMKLSINLSLNWRNKRNNIFVGNFDMPNDSKALFLQTKENKIKKEVEYLHRQFPWKSIDEIAVIFSEKGSIDKIAFKKLSGVHLLNKGEED